MIKYFQSKKNHFPLRCIAFIVALSFLFTTVSAPFAQASIWSERSKASKSIQFASAKMSGGVGAVQDSLSPGKLGGEMADIETTLLRGKENRNILSEALFKKDFLKRRAPSARSNGNLNGIPSDLWEKVSAFGSVQKVHMAKGQELKMVKGRIVAKTPFVVNLQDVHDVYGVQRNLAFLISELTESGADLVGLEGSEGKMEGLETWRQYPDRESLMEVAGYLMKSGLITGVELAGLERKESEAEFYGLEQKQTYLDQVDSFKTTLAKKADIQKWENQVESVLAELKEKTYSASQKEMDASRILFDAQKEPLGDRIEFLARADHQVFTSNRSQYSNIGKYLKTRSLEKSMDFRKISKEQKKLFVALSNKLSQNDLVELLQDSLLYRLGKIGYAEFYSSLKNRCVRSGVAMTPEVSKYVEYVSAVEGISQEGLFSELSRLEDQVWKRSFTTAISLPSAIHELDEDFRLAKKGLDFSMSPQDYERYNSREAQIAKINGRIQEASVLLGEAVAIKEEMSRDLLANVSRFNRLSHERNQIFVQKLTQRMQEKGKNFSVIVAGGYHTGGMEELLKSKDVSFITIRPKINLAEMKEGHHPLQAFIREPLPLEKLFVQEKVTIVHAQSLGSAAAFGMGRTAQTAKGIFSVLVPALSLSKLIGRDSETFQIELTKFVQANGLEAVKISKSRVQGDLFLADVAFAKSKYTVSISIGNDASFADKLLKSPEALLTQLGIIKGKPQAIISGQTVSQNGTIGSIFAVAEYPGSLPSRLWSSILELSGSVKRNATALSFAAFISTGIGALVYNKDQITSLLSLSILGLMTLGFALILRVIPSQLLPARTALPFGQTDFVVLSGQPNGLDGSILRSMSGAFGSASDGKSIGDDGIDGVQTAGVQLEVEEIHDFLAKLQNNRSVSDLFSMIDAGNAILAKAYAIENEYEREQRGQSHSAALVREIENLEKFLDALATYRNLYGDIGNKSRSDAVKAWEDDVAKFGYGVTWKGGIEVHPSLGGTVVGARNHPAGVASEPASIDEAIKLANEDTTFVASEPELVPEVMHVAVVVAAAGVVAEGHRGNTIGVTDKNEIGKLKKIADGAAKKLVEAVLVVYGIRALFHVSEGFGRDEVEVSFRGGELVNPNGTHGTRHAIIDVIEGTNVTASNLDGKPFSEISRAESGGTSVVVHGDGVEALGNAPDIYSDQFYSRVPAQHEERVQQLINTRLKSESVQAMTTVLQAVAQANGIGIGDMEVVIMRRTREAKRLKSLRAIQKEHPGLEITEIEDGTVPHGLLAAIGVKPNSGQKHKVIWTVGGSAEAFMNLAIAGSIPGAVGALTIYSKSVNKTADGKDAEDMGRKYSFTDDEKAEIRDVRPEDAEVILAGKKTFTTADVKGSVEGHFAFITHNGVFHQPGAREISKGVFRVNSLRVRDGKAFIQVDDVSQEMLSRFVAFGNALGEMGSSAVALFAGLFEGVRNHVEMVIASAKDLLGITDGVSRVLLGDLQISGPAHLLDPIKANPEAWNWLVQRAAQTGVDKVEFVSEDTDDPRMIKEAIEAGEIIDLGNGTYHARSHPKDTARTVSRTFVATNDPEDKGNFNNWAKADDIRPIVENLMKDASKGKIMYVIPYLMGPAGNPLEKWGTGIELTDNRYVALNMFRMARTGQIAIDAIARSNQFVRGVHVTGDLESLKQGTPDDQRYFLTLPETREILHYGSAYGGNALLAKIAHGLRLASFDAGVNSKKDPNEREWLVAQMGLLEIEDLSTGEKFYKVVGFPSASGKTNLVMMDSPEELKDRYRVRFLGDDIVWMWKGEDGKVYAINPEYGTFGVAPGTSEESNPQAIKAVGAGSGTIFTNVARNVKTHEVWWEGKSPMPTDLENWLDWEGKPVNERSPEDMNKPWAQPNSRFTTKIDQVAVRSDMWDSPEGVPLSAVIWGGRVDTSLEPVVRQLRNSVEGVYDGTVMNVQTTAAAETKATTNPDPMAMMGFYSYPEDLYFGDWLSMMKDIPFFHVNWFQRRADRSFRWPGYVHNIRILGWMLGRIKGEASAVETPVGFVPTPESLDLRGLKLSDDDLSKLLGFDREAWKAEMERRQVYLFEVGEGLPGMRALPAEITESHERVKGLIARYERGQFNGNQNAIIDAVRADFASRFGTEMVSHETQMGPSGRNRGATSIIFAQAVSGSIVKPYIVKETHQTVMPQLEQSRSKIAGELGLGPKVIYTVAPQPGSRSALMIEEYIDDRDSYLEREARLSAAEKRVVAAKLAEKIYLMHDVSNAGRVTHKLDDMPAHLMLVGKGAAIEPVFVDWGLNSEVSEANRLDKISTAISVAINTFSNDAKSFARFMARLRELASERSAEELELYDLAYAKVRASATQSTLLSSRMRRFFADVDATKVTGLRSKLEGGWVIANHILVSFHSAFILSFVHALFFIPNDVHGSGILKHILLNPEQLFTMSLFGLTYWVGVWWHERGHYWEAVKLLTLKKDALELAQQNQKGWKRIVWETRMLLIAPTGKFPGIKKEGLGYYVESPFNLSVTAAGPLASGRMARVALPAAAILFTLSMVDRSFGLFGALGSLSAGYLLFGAGRLFFGFGAVAGLDRLLADKGRVKEFKERARKAREAREGTVQTAAGSWLDRSSEVKRIMRETRLQEVTLADGTRLRAPWGFRNSAMGGEHTKAQYPESNISFQEGMFIPLSAKNYEEAQEMTVRLQTRLLALINSTEGTRFMGIGLEGGLSAYITPEAGDKIPEQRLWRMMKQAIEESGYRPGVDVVLALDPAASELENAFKEESNQEDAVGQYYFYRDPSRHVILSRDEMIEIYVKAMEDDIPIVSIEDGFAEDDFEGWSMLREKLGDKIFIIGDDLVTTNDRVIEDQRELFDAQLTKANQIGTLSETVSAMLVAIGRGKELVISHRSQSPNDPFEAHIALAYGSVGLKAGGGANTERLVKYQAVLEVMKEAIARAIKGRQASEKQDFAINEITAFETPTNSGNPTVKVKVSAGNQQPFEGATPLGTSAGTGEAIHLLDSVIEPNNITRKYPELFEVQKGGDGVVLAFRKAVTSSDISSKSDAELQALWNLASRYSGKGVQKAVSYVDTIIAPVFAGRKASELGSLIDIDNTLLALELKVAQERGKSTSDVINLVQRKQNLGMNAILAVSLALARVKAQAEGKEFWEVLREPGAQAMASIIAELDGRDKGEVFVQFEFEDLKTEFARVVAEKLPEGERLDTLVRKHLGLYENLDGIAAQLSQIQPQPSAPARQGDVLRSNALPFVIAPLALLLPAFGTWGMIGGGVAAVLVATIIWKANVIGFAKKILPASFTIAASGVFLAVSMLFQSDHAKSESGATTPSVLPYRLTAANVAADSVQLAPIPSFGSEGEFRTWVQQNPGSAVRAAIASGYSLDYAAVREDAQARELAQKMFANASLNPRDVLTALANNDINQDYTEDQFSFGTHGKYTIERGLAGVYQANPQLAKSILNYMIAHPNETLPETFRSRTLQESISLLFVDVLLKTHSNPGTQSARQEMAIYMVDSMNDSLVRSVARYLNTYGAVTFEDGSLYSTFSGAQKAKIDGVFDKAKKQQSDSNLPPFTRNLFGSMLGFLSLGVVSPKLNQSKSWFFKLGSAIAGMMKPKKIAYAQHDSNPLGVEMPTSGEVRALLSKLEKLEVSSEWDSDLENLHAWGALHQMRGQLPTGLAPQLERELSQEYVRVARFLLVLSVYRALFKASQGRDSSDSLVIKLKELERTILDSGFDGAWDSLNSRANNSSENIYQNLGVWLSPDGAQGSNDSLKIFLNAQRLIFVEDVHSVIREIRDRSTTWQRNVRLLMALDRILSRNILGGKYSELVAEVGPEVIEALDQVDALGQLKAGIASNASLRPAVYVLFREIRANISDHVNAPANAQTQNIANIYKRLDDDAANRALLEAAANAEISADNPYREIGYEGQFNRLGWVIPPSADEAMKYVAQIDAMMEGMESVIFIGMGGSINSGKAHIGIMGRGNIKVDTLDSLDPAALEKVLEGKDLKKTLVVVISKSATTAEPLGLTNIFQRSFGDAWSKHILVLTDPENVRKLPENYFGATTLPIQVDRSNTIGGRFTAPLTGTWLLPAYLFNGNKLRDIYKRFLAGFESAAWNAMLTARRIHEDGNERIAVVVDDSKMKNAMNTWIIQLFQESLGSKIDGFYPKTIVVARGEAVPAGFRALDIKVESTDVQSRTMLLQYGYERFVAELARLKGINFVNQDGVEAYKSETRRLVAKNEALMDPEKVDVPRLVQKIQDSLAKDPKDFVDLVLYGEFEEDVLQVLQYEVQSKLPQGVWVQVFVGSDWNHHSYQAAKDDPNTLFVILQKSDYAIPEGQIFEESRDVLSGNIKTLKIIARATYNTLESKALFFSIGKEPITVLASHKPRRPGLSAFYRVNPLGALTTWSTSLFTGAMAEFRKAPALALLTSATLAVAISAGLLGFTAVGVTAFVLSVSVTVALRYQTKEKISPWTVKSERLQFAVAGLRSGATMDSVQPFLVGAAAELNGAPGFNRGSVAEAQAVGTVAGLLLALRSSADDEAVRAAIGKFFDAAVDQDGMFEPVKLLGQLDANSLKFSLNQSGASKTLGRISKLFGFASKSDTLASFEEGVVRGVGLAVYSSMPQKDRFGAARKIADLSNLGARMIDVSDVALSAQGESGSSRIQAAVVKGTLDELNLDRASAKSKGVVLVANSQRALDAIQSRMADDSKLKEAVKLGQVRLIVNNHDGRISLDEVASQLPKSWAQDLELLTSMEERFIGSFTLRIRILELTSELSGREVHTLMDITDKIRQSNIIQMQA